MSIKRINADRFYTPPHCVALCVKPSGYAERYVLKTLIWRTFWRTLVRRGNNHDNT